MERLSTAGICFNKDGKVLIGKRIDEGPLALKWEFPGGKNRWGETVEDTLKREWKEELGVDIRVLENIGETEFENWGVVYRLIAARVELLDESAKFTPFVHTEFKWVSITELGYFDMADSDDAIRKQIIAKSKDSSNGVLV